ncbi:hypothetical protein GBA52_008905 [Prunus armeniaca]|nr:hypothetical protein GBA52_008854 [Prunus armeniaca]KAH0981728.1 hypothetical protein GBA52_008905 [Prunus armeniaca]
MFTTTSRATLILISKSNSRRNMLDFKIKVADRGFQFQEMSHFTRGRMVVLISETARHRRALQNLGKIFVVCFKTLGQSNLLPESSGRL